MNTVQTTITVETTITVAGNKFLIDCRLGKHNLYKTSETIEDARVIAAVLSCRLVQMASEAQNLESELNASMKVGA